MVHVELNWREPDESRKIFTAGSKGTPPTRSKKAKAKARHGSCGPGLLASAWFQGDDSSLVSPFRPKSFAAVQSTGRFSETSIGLEAINKWQLSLLVCED
jgi:hypothetical protein